MKLEVSNIVGFEIAQMWPTGARQDAFYARSENAAGRSLLKRFDQA